MATYLRLALFGLLLPASLAHADEWSKPVNNVKGKLIAEQQGNHIRLIVELKNDGVLPYWLTTHDPFAFDLTVRDADGKQLKPDLTRIDVVSSPQPAILPRECQLALPVTIHQKDHGNLDITTEIWSLKPGKYKLTGKYFIRDEQFEPKLDGVAYRWRGTIELPEIEVEVAEKEKKSE